MNCSVIKAADGSSYRLSKREKEWIAASNDQPAALLCIRYALVYTKRNPKWLLDECAPEVEYSSQIVDNVHIGKDEVSQVFVRRISDPDNYPESGGMPLIELAVMPDGRLCGVLHQRRGRFDNGIGKPYFWMTFANNDEGKVVSMQSGYFPSCLALDRSGIFPGLTAARLRQEKGRLPVRYPAGVPLQFLFAHSRHDTDWLRSAEAAKEVLHYFNMATFKVIPLDLDPSVKIDRAWLYERSVFSLPHLHITSCGENILRLDGPFDRERLMQELYLRFRQPGGTSIEPGIVKELLADEAPGMAVAEQVQCHYFCDPDRMSEILDAFVGDNPLAARRAAYVLDRLSFLKNEVIQPYRKLLLGVSYEDPNKAKLRHVARMVPRLSLTDSEKHQAEQLLLNLSWQQIDAPLQVFALKSLRYFAKTNFLLREYAGPFVFELMRHTRNGRVVREAEITLDTIEYFDEKTHEQWDRQMARA